MLTYALCIIVSWIYVTVMHEVSHAFVAHKDGATKARIYPWPHMHEGWLYFARYSYEGKTYTGSKNFIDKAPLVMDFVTMFLAVTISLFPGFIPFSNCLVVAAFIDQLVWYWGFFFGGPHTDGHKYRYGRGEKP